MILQSVFFHIFSFVMLAAAFMVIASRNPVHSVLFLILAFFNSAGLFILLGAEFLAMVLVVVYVGAVAVLFLFVVMMLDVDFAELRQGFLQYLPIGALVGFILLAELIFIVGGMLLSPEITADPVFPIPSMDETSNIAAIGALLYTEYVFFFQLAGMILFVAMIGAIVLALRHKAGVKRQNIASQVCRAPEEAIEIVTIRPGQGI